jgi:hypothetical protein
MTPSSVNVSEMQVSHADGLLGDINNIWFDVASNADGGVAVTVVGANERDVDVTVNADVSSLDGPTGNEISSVDTTGSGSAEVTLVGGDGLYGLRISEDFTPTSDNGVTITVDDNYNDGGYGMVPSPNGTGATGPETIFSTADPIVGGRVGFFVGAAPDAADGTGTYTDQLTFVATGTF